jgi:CysZ protein
MFATAAAAFFDVFSMPFRRVLFKTLTLTLALLAVIFFLSHKLLVSAINLPYPWLTTILSLLTGVGLFIGLAFLLTPASFVISGFFFDELAEEVELNMAPMAIAGRTLPFGEALWLGTKFAALSLVVNLIALALFLVPGVNAIAFLGANAYLLGRGYFEMAALRYLPQNFMRQYRNVHAARLYLAGLGLALLLAVPILNLLIPLFATAFMIRLNQALLRSKLPDGKVRWMP